jgi:hypothetical protein
MNIVELLLFVLALAFSFLFGRYFVSHLGWWGILPGILLGFGLVFSLVNLLHRLRSRQKSKSGRRDR